MLAKNDEKFEALRREQSAPTTAGPSSQPDEQPDEGRLAQPLSRHRASKRGRSSPSLDRVVNLSDSECTDSDSPAAEIEMRTHGKTSTSGNTASDMCWAYLDDEVTDKLRQRIYSNEYFALRILRTYYDLYPQEDPAAFTLDVKLAVITVDQIGEWLHLFMTDATIRAERYAEEGSQLITYMDHILTTRAQKRPRVWLDYDYRFRVRRERTDTPWNLFNYPLYSSLKTKC